MGNALLMAVVKRLQDLLENSGCNFFREEFFLDDTPETYSLTEAADYTTVASSHCVDYIEAPVGTFTRGSQVYLAGAVTREQILSVGKIDETGDLNIQLSQIAADKINSGMFGLDTAKGLVATDQMTICP